MKIILYISNFNNIGGVERFVLNFYKRFPETTVLYDTGTPAIGEKIRWNQKYICDIFISASAWGKPAFNNIEAISYIQMVHADYTAVLDGWNFKYVKNAKTTHHVCVSETVKKAFEEVTPYKCNAVFYNFIDDSLQPVTKQKNDILRLVTVSRISKEKGFERMVEFQKKIPVPFIWEVWGDDRSGYAKNIVRNFNFKGVTKTPHLEIAKADYLVQLSDSEGNSCVINEALQMKTPVLLTPFPSGFEQVEHGNNGYFIPFDLNSIDFDSIINKIPRLKKYKEKTNVKDWINFFKFVINDFHKHNKMVKIKVLKTVTNYKEGDIAEVSEERAKSAIERGLAEFYEAYEDSEEGTKGITTRKNIKQVDKEIKKLNKK